MKKIIALIIICINITCTLVCFANGNNIMFTKNNTISDEMNLNSDIIWSGKEWVTTKYPPEVSDDGVSFEKLEKTM